jgi:RNA polymerase sigma-70 factor (ECF subfamily)
VVDDDEITRNAFRAARGDRAAAARFVADTQHLLFRFLVCLSDSGVAEDLVQETFLRAFAALPNYAGRSSARVWLLAIAKRVAADHLRARRRRPLLGLAEDWATVAEHAGPRAPDHGPLVAIQALIGALEPERREAWVFTQVLGLSYADTAELCRCATGTIRSRVFRAREELMKALDADSGSPVLLQHRVPRGGAPEPRQTQAVRHHQAAGHRHRGAGDHRVEQAGRG